jgi:hypothetical protein
VVVVGVVVGVALLTVQSLADIRENNDAAREALAAIAKHRDEFLDAKNKMAAQEARIGMSRRSWRPIWRPPPRR